MRPEKVWAKAGASDPVSKTQIHRTRATNRRVDRVKAFRPGVSAPRRSVAATTGVSRIGFAGRGIITLFPCDPGAPGAIAGAGPRALLRAGAWTQRDRRDPGNGFLPADPLLNWPHESRPLRHLPRGPLPPRHRVRGAEAPRGRGLRGRGAGVPDLLRAAGLQLRRPRDREDARAQGARRVPRLRLRGRPLRLLLGPDEGRHRARPLQGRAGPAGVREARGEVVRAVAVPRGRAQGGRGAGEVRRQPSPTTTAARAFASWA